MPHILILMSDTGGGHRSAAEAIQQAIQRLDHDGRFTTELLDFIKKTTIPPWNQLDRLYKPMVDHTPWLWRMGFHLTSFWPICQSLKIFNASVAGPKMLRLLRNYPADLVVSVHPFATTVPGRILQSIRADVPFVTIVTDLVSTHPFWFSKGADLTFVASQEARRHALKAGVPEGKIEVTGLPIDLRFADLSEDKKQIKQAYGMPTERSMILLIGGADGIGQLEAYAEAIADSNLPLSLMIIAGRNEKLRHRLNKQKWRIPTKVTGFVRDMPHRMAAADLLITKAGPGTLCEGLAARLPSLIWGFIPGQEEGNVRWITENGAGRLTPTTDQIIKALHTFFDQHGPTSAHQKAKQAAQALARPDAALTIAQRLMEMAERGGDA